MMLLLALLSILSADRQVFGFQAVAWQAYKALSQLFEEVSHQLPPTALLKLKESLFPTASSSQYPASLTAACTGSLSSSIAAVSGNTNKKSPPRNLHPLQEAASLVSPFKPLAWALSSTDLYDKHLFSGRIRNCYLHRLSRSSTKEFRQFCYLSHDSEKEVTMIEARGTVMP